MTSSNNKIMSDKNYILDRIEESDAFELLEMVLEHPSILADEDILNEMKIRNEMLSRDLTKKQFIAFQELLSMPKALQAHIISRLGLGEVEYKDDIVCPDGTIFSDSDIEDLFLNLVSELSDDTINERIGFETAYIVDITNVVYDIEDLDGVDQDSLEREHTFVLFSDDVSEEDAVDDIYDVVGDKVSDKTGFTFLSCQISSIKYKPFEDTKKLNME